MERGWRPQARDDGPPRHGASSATAHQNAQSPPQAPTGLSPPSGAPFPPFHPPSHGLASLAGVTQSSPRQQPPPPPPPRRGEERQQHPGFPLPNITQATGQPRPGTQADRERQEGGRQEEQKHIKEEEDRRRHEEKRRRLEQTPMLHQPVALGPGRAHGPNSILGNPAIAGPQPAPPPLSSLLQGPQMPLGAPAGPANIFAGGPVQQMQPGLLMPFAPSQQHQAQATPQQHMQGHQQQQPPPPPPQAQGQGQQPILNDALSYLDQVKVQFADHPDVYNRFLDIMKDFKSGAIDTPGVIGRVSTLFAGNPVLIQGFNTFLPPGYRIECGAGDDPNAIRVTTPMGTTVQAMPQARPLSRQDGPGGDGGRTFTPQLGAQSAQMMFSPSGRPVGPAAPGQQHLSPFEAARQQQQQQDMHAQQQRGVNSLQNAVSAATGAGGLRIGVSPRATPLPGQQDGQEEKQRSPVEFNHAISYVNKIKNRFSQHPDIYKQFLEILQTYQRESKPIQDVYSQVTYLFRTAPDLLEDFKQFLPESAAQAKAAERARQMTEENAMLSHVRGEARWGGGVDGSPIMSREIGHQGAMGTPSHGRGMPPVGNFAPTPISKEQTKKRKPERQGTADSLAGPSNAKAPAFAAQGGGKRQKSGTNASAKTAGATDQPPVSPSLVPALPMPLQPTTTSAATHDEIMFFDRVKKAIGNKGTFNEFLKLCNLFSQDFIDRTTLVHRTRAFIGNNPDLMACWEKVVRYDKEAITIENKPRVPSGRVSLSNCRGLGPSYRLLPKRERQKPCSGRDELCNAVLNDEWASHPTWASEDSGFIAHRKNLHEEGLHRIEEERHDYDYNIEACARTIQLLEPIAQQLRRLSESEQRVYSLPLGLGGQSESIYKRIVMKVYGRVYGRELMDDLLAKPYVVIPILLNRLKERLETWKLAQREWEKVWREQTQKMFWKSLDHQAINNSKTDRRQFQTKSLQSEIAVRHEEMRRLENTLRNGTMKKPQLEAELLDMDVIVDVTRLLLVYIHTTMETEQPRLPGFIREFVPLLFGLDADLFGARLNEKFGETPPNELADEPLSGAEEVGVTRGRQRTKGRSLLQQTLDGPRGSKMGRRGREDSNASASRASTPNVASVGEPEEMVLDAAAPTNEAEAATTETKTEQTTVQRWFAHPNDGNMRDGEAKANIDPSEPQKRDCYKMWANTTIYCFVRLFIVMYERLHKLKQSETGVAETVKNANKPKPAIDLGIMDKLPSDFFSDTSSTAKYYSQMLTKFEDVVKGELEMVDVEDTLRRFYLQSGYPLYGIEKMIQATSRFAQQVLNSEVKEKSWEIFQLFRKDRVKEEVTMGVQTDYKKAVEKLVRDSDLYRIDYDETSKKVMFYLVKKTDPAYYLTGDSPLERENKWRAYVASYETVDDTDGVPRDDLQLPFLVRNTRAMGMDPKSTSYPPSPPPQPADAADPSTRTQAQHRIMRRLLATKNEENLQLRIDVGQYRAFFSPNTQEGWSEPFPDRAEGEEGMKKALEVQRVRDEEVREKFVMVNPAMKGLGREEVERRNKAFKRMAEGRPAVDEREMGDAVDDEDDGGKGKDEKKEIGE